MDVSCMNAFPGVCLCVCSVALLSSWHVSLLRCTCVCLSHPSRAVHLYMSETSIEIDSSDGMISDPSTPSSSSSEEEGPSSDDDDDDDDSDWGDGNRQRDRNTDKMPARKPAGLMPRWQTWIPLLVQVETRWREPCCWVKNKHIVQAKEENGKKIPFRRFRNTARDQGDAFDDSFEMGSKGQTLYL